MKKIREVLHLILKWANSVISSVKGAIKSIPRLVTHMIEYARDSYRQLRDSKRLAFSELPQCLKDKTMSAAVLGLACFFALSLAAIIYKSTDFFFCGVFLFAVTESAAARFYYLFTRESFTAVIAVPLSKKVKRRIRKTIYTLTICCPDGTERDVTMQKREHSKIIIGADYVFYFAKGELEPNYDVMYCCERRFGIESKESKESKENVAKTS